MGRYWDGNRLLDRDRGSGKFSRWESAVFSVEIENGAGSAGGTGTEERVRVAGTFPFLASLDGSFQGNAHSNSLTSGRARRGRR